MTDQVDVRKVRAFDRVYAQLPPEEQSQVDAMLKDLARGIKQGAAARSGGTSSIAFGPAMAKEVFVTVARLAAEG